MANPNREDEDEVKVDDSAECSLQISFLKVLLYRRHCAFRHLYFAIDAFLLLVLLFVLIPS